MRVLWWLSLNLLSQITLCHLLKSHVPWVPSIRMSSSISHLFGIRRNQIMLLVLLRPAGDPEVLLLQDALQTLIAFVVAFLLSPHSR